MRVKFDPASADGRVWKVSVAHGDGDVAVDFTTIRAEDRTFLAQGGYFEAEPDADGWEIVCSSAQAESEIPELS